MYILLIVFEDSKEKNAPHHNRFSTMTEIPTSYPVSSTISILYVDDEPALLEIARLFLERMGNYSVLTCDNALDALKIISERSFDVIISDYQMPGCDGISFLKHLRKSSNKTPFIIFTGKGREDVVIEALNEGADFYLQKGGDPKSQFAELHKKIEYAVQKRLAEIKLKESEEIYRAIFETTGTGTIIIDTDTTIILANAGFAALSGYTREELEGKHSWREFVHQEDLERMKHYHADRRDDPLSSPHRYNFRFIDRFGTIKHCINNVSMIPATSWSVASVLDITGMKQAEEALEKSEEKYRTLFENAHEGIVVEDDNHIIFSNSAAIELLGCPEEVISSHSLLSFIHPDDRGRVRDSYQRMVTGEDLVLSNECRIMTGDGAEKVVRIKSRVVLFNNRSSLLTFIEDITSFSEISQEIQTLKTQFEYVLDATKTGFDIIDEEYNTIYVDPGWVDKLGDYSGKKCYEYFMGRKTPCETCVIHEAITTGELKVSDEFLLKEGRHIEVHTIPLKERINGRRLVAEFNIDITRRKATEKALRLTNKKLQLLSSITRHDILNKIMTARGYLELAKEDASESDQRLSLDEIEHATSFIQKQIEFTSEYEQLGVKEPVWNSISDIILKIGDSRLPIILSCPVALVYADPLIERVLYNFYDNSLRYAEGASRVRVLCENNDGCLRIIWEDDGPGIPDEVKEHIFDHGYGKNMGFGLFISREILSITGITLKETGVYGEGARFEMLVPDGYYR